MPDPIAPPSATFPAEVVALVSLAISDGDLDAALAQYEPGAVLELWAASPWPAAPGLASSLAQLMELRLPLSAAVRDVLTSSEVAAGADPRGGADPTAHVGLAGCLIALVLADRHIVGTGPDCQPVDLRGSGATAVRRQPDGSWRIVADAWRLAPGERG